MDPQINIYNSCSKYSVRVRSVSQLVRTLLNRLGLEAFGVDLTFCGTQRIRGLNQTTRGQDKPTDVLSYPLLTFASLPRFAGKKHLPLRPAETLLGDLFVCLPVAARNAQKIGQSLAEETVFLIVHGILHLCGYDHQVSGDETKMLVQQKKLKQYLQSNFTIMSIFKKEQ